MNLLFSPSSAEDLRSISAHTLERWGQKQEVVYLRGLWKLLERIRSQPGAFRRREEIASGCQSAVYASHIIFFRVQGQTIQVMRILHHAMDLRSHLAEEDSSD